MEEYRKKEDVQHRMDADRQTIAHLITGEAENPVATDRTDRQTIAELITDNTENPVATDTDTDETDKQTQIGTEMVITETTTTARRSVFVAIAVIKQ